MAYAAGMQLAYGAPYGSPAGAGGMGMPLSPVSGMQVGVRVWVGGAGVLFNLVVLVKWEWPPGLIPVHGLCCFSH